MDIRAYTGIPVAITLGTELLFPYFYSLTCTKVWFSPPAHVCMVFFLAINVLLGFTLYEAQRLDNTEMFVMAWVAFALNLAWAHFMKRDDRYTLILLFLALLVGYFIYNAIFLSSLTDNQNTVYLNLYSVYIIWLGFTITMVFEYANQKRRKLK